MPLLLRSMPLKRLPGLERRVEAVLENHSWVALKAVDLAGREG
jgi:hypothetical protein